MEKKSRLFILRPCLDPEISQKHSSELNPFRDINANSQVSGEMSKNEQVAKSGMSSGRNT